jgi:hypothetical protein
MAFGSWQATFLSPATIAIHDDGDVTRYILEIFGCGHGAD